MTISHLRVLKRTTTIFIGLLLHRFAASAQTPSQLNSTEKILYNAKIFTANAAQPYADAVAIDGGVIKAVGRLAMVKRSASVKAILIDMHGQRILPGFIDSHCHALQGGAELSRANVSDRLLSVQQLVDYALKSKKDRSGMIGNWLVIYGVNIATWSHLKELSALIDQGEFTSVPVLLNGSDGHTHLGNKALMQQAGLNKTFIQRLPVSKRKYYGIINGQPNGFVADSGYATYSRVMPAEKINWKKAGELALKNNNGFGITAWLDPLAGDIADTVNDYLDEYSSEVKNHTLTAHVAAAVRADADADPAPQVNKLKNLQIKYNATRDFKVIGFKIFADGVVEYPTQTAAMSKPYTNSGKYGPLMFNPHQFAHFVTVADKAGLLVHVHAIGDRAVAETLNGFEAARKANGNTGIPHTITHLQFVQPADIPRFKQLHVLASMQLMWALGDVTTIDIVKPYIAPEIYKWQYPAQSLLKAGAMLCGASDWPVSSDNPFEAIYEAETRKGEMGVLDPSQRVSRLAMLYAYTINAAKALRMEKSIGSIEPGKSADLILPDRDVLTVTAQSMHKTKILWTMFEGRIVYQAK